VKIETAATTKRIRRRNRRESNSGSNIAAARHKPTSRGAIRRTEAD
jgi:hypothetical protein